MALKHIVCVGYAKCGTTMLHSTFEKTPGIATPLAQKEIKFFLPKTMPQEDTYARYLQAFFDSPEKQTQAQYTFEASPPYIHLPLGEFKGVLENIRRTIPKSRIVLCVRQPFVRAYSHYIHDLHQFGLFGANVFDRKRRLLEAPYEVSFADAMKAGRASIGYAERLKAILEFFDPSAVSIFFLEWDVQRFRDWVSNLTTPEIAAGLPLKSDVPNQVIRRRKLPNYVNTGNALIAFGSRKGELVEYKNVPEKRLLRIMRTRRKWTLNLSSEEIRQGTQEFFGKDLEECAALTGSENFLRYLNDEFPAERAEFSHPRSLERLHQWTGPAPDTPSTVAATALKTAVPSRKVAVLSRSFSEHETLRGELLARFPGTQFNETGRTLAGDELVEFLQGRDAIVVALEKIDAALLARLPDLRIISKYGVGLDNVDLEACAKVGVRVGWTGGVNRQSVAELTVAFAIDCLRHVMQSHTEIQTGTFRQIRGRNLQGNTVGLIGCGHVGQRVARLFQAFGCTVLAHDIRSFPEFYKETGVEPVSFDDLLARADIVSLHVPLTPATRNMIGEAALARMKHDAVLINTARGGLVDEEALKAALKAKKLYGAAFDVFSPEPPQDTELLALPNFIATGHIGGSTAQSVLAMGRAAIDGLESAIDALDHIPDYLR